MIYQTIDFNDFRKAFINQGREKQFSYAGLLMLYDYLDGLSNDTGRDIELDVIALCCQYSELCKAEYLTTYKHEGIETIEELERALIEGDLERVIAYDIEENIILVNDDY